MAFPKDSSVLIYNDEHALIVIPAQEDEEKVLRKEGYHNSSFLCKNLADPDHSIIFSYYVDYFGDEEFIEAYLMLRGHYQDVFELAEVVGPYMVPFADVVADYYDEQYFKEFTDSEMLCQAIYDSFENRGANKGTFFFSENGLVRFTIVLVDYIGENAA